MERKEFFSPNQIYVGTMIGGPFAAAYYLRENANRLGHTRLYSLIIPVCIVFTVLLLWFSYQLPEDFPSMLLPIIYAGSAAGIAWHWQVSKEEVKAVEHYGFQSNWKVAGVSLASLLTLLVCIFVFVLVLPSG